MTGRGQVSNLSLFLTPSIEPLGTDFKSVPSSHSDKENLLCKFRGQSKNFARNFTLTPPIRMELHIVGACRALIMKV